MSMQVCTCCGWAKVTTYQGLRIHQGKMGCTEKGRRIPEGRGVQDYAPRISFAAPLVSLDEPVVELLSSLRAQGWERSQRSQRSALTAAQASVLEAIASMAVTPPSGPSLQEVQGVFDSTSVVLSKKSLSSQPLVERWPQTPGRRVLPDLPTDWSGEPVFQTPVNPRHHQTAPKANRARRVLDFATGAEHVQERTVDPPRLHTGQQDQVHAGNHGTEAPPTTARPTEDKEEKQREEEKQRKEEKQREEEKQRKEEKQREEEKLRLKAKQDKTRAELQQEIQMRELKMAEVRLAVKGFKVRLDSEWLEVNDAFSAVIQVVEDARQKALRPLEDRRRDVKREANDLLQRLDGDIKRLQRSLAELDRNPETQLSRGRDPWKNPSVDTSFSLGTFRSMTAAMTEQIQLQMEKLSSVELRRIQAHAVDVKLDPATAHRRLALSQDGKKVQDAGKRPAAPDTPTRFDMFASVLGINRLTSGRSYWEVEVSHKTGWDLGVASGAANRKGKLTLNPDNGYWATVHYEDKGYAALTAPPTRLELRDRPQKVGVFVDYEEGLVSFYDVEASGHIYSFTDCSFGGDIFPYFSPHLEHDGQNSAPLTISSAGRQ